MITIVGGLCFAIQDAGIKWLSAEIAVLQILFLRSLFGLAFLGASTSFSGERISLKVNRPWLLAVRSPAEWLRWTGGFFLLLLLFPLFEAERRGEDNVPSITFPRQRHALQVIDNLRTYPGERACNEWSGHLP